MVLPSFLTSLLDNLSALFTSQNPFTWLDYIVFVIFLFYAVQGFSIGFIESFTELISFALSFTFGLKLYGIVGKLLMSAFSLSPGFANAIGFFVAATIFEIIFKIIFGKLFPRLSEISRFDRLETLAFANKLLGFFSGIASAFVLLSFLFSILVSLPISVFLSRSISRSYVGKLLVSRTQNFEKNLRDIFGGSLYDTVHFFTVSPHGDDFVSLRFKVQNGTRDTKSEKQMFELVNKERTSAGLLPLLFDEELSEVGLEHSKDMFERGYFSHHTPEGAGPVDRMVGISFSVAGENLALAPSVDLAMQGLMNSPGHRANILSEKFHKIGIGAVDAGVYGIMFTQEFTD
ncbi:MAG: hypothetical protein A3F31_02680 [Candidatus Levybacteria bacterium RIFCSPHIGHO2_12_FULL_38_12]|nr:MAG: hypothetical protein A2770_00405 [Candidatus Levybacteria bacterium RIFCSPHIGHO2_01_FULL_38_12]OGH22188.1 MAG: hypothetical protein A3D75_01870 [Candidatus Levybacteria bacterium RIFCSPHIGHO2_02_FULL_37_18]OGH22297.1 MAG: hypothetical protein A3F31_02680 [Candidatus Levybacteria bacterium RIFCSPHIGHO2_12_FULL_38_12]OGH34355.1 MAG: hypothetical protein A3A47_02060 [Candidatus Levybacteria bacterium RIFCSPLOWO2_01_FULL_37_20]OGH44237.1 MAG: hypothetical protein A3J14_01645 [Candidatus Lev